MKAVYFPTMSCWRVIAGEEIISVNDVWSWETIKDLKYDLSKVGLQLNKQNEIKVVEVCL